MNGNFLDDPYAPHSSVARREIPGKPNVFIHVEGYYVQKGEFATFVHLDQKLINTNGRGSGGKTKDKGTFFAGLEGQDTLLYVRSWE